MRPVSTTSSTQQPNTNLGETSHEQADFYDFTKAKGFAEKLISRWTDRSDGMIKTVEDNRKTRRAVVDVEKMQSSGKLRPNHTFVGVRLIDGNVVNSLPAHLMYLKQSRRLGIFNPRDSRLITERVNDITNLESEFTRVLTYPGWEEDYIRLLDGSALHGCDWLGVFKDESKPGHCAVDYIGVEKLLYDPNVSNIQSSRMVLRAYVVTRVDLRRLADQYEFDEAASKELNAKLEEQQGSGKNLDASAQYDNTNKFYIYQVFFKDDAGVVHSAWYAKDLGKWLKAPEPFYNGIRRRVVTVNPVASGVGMDMQESVTFVDEPQYQYPFFQKVHRITEEPTIFKAQGRAFLDQYKQDASSSVLSSFINGCLDATCTMWAPSGRSEESQGTAPKHFAISIEYGKVWDQPMTAFNTQYPDSTLLTALDKISTLNQAETAQVSWAVVNRQGDGGRKTATEVQKSSEQQTVMSGIEVLMFSLTLTAVLNYAWLIIRSAALEDEINFLPDAQGKSNKVILGFEYSIKPAGDIDFVERQQNVKKMQEDWPVFQQTPLRDTFLEDYIRARYTERAEHYISVLRQGNIQAAMAQTLQQTLQMLGTVMQQAQQNSPAIQAMVPSVQQLAQQGVQLIQQVEALQPGATQSQSQSEPQQ